MKLGVLILAAGEGTRMRSRRPKVLHQLAGKPLLSHVIGTARELSPDEIVIVYGHGGEQVRDLLDAPGLDWCEQEQRLGTGHAVIQALPYLKGVDQVVILYGDVPLLEKATLSAMLEGLSAMEGEIVDDTGATHRPTAMEGESVDDTGATHRPTAMEGGSAGNTGATSRPTAMEGGSAGNAGATSRPTELVLLTVKLDEPTGYGRILRSQKDQVTAIVEHKDASEDQLKIREINTGIMAVKRERLEGWLARIDNRNSQQEYYLTDIIALAVADGVEIRTVNPASEQEVMGINDRQQLAYLERHFQSRIADRLMQSGVTLADPNRIDVRGNLQVGRDVFIDCNAVFEGDVEIADGVSIGPGVLIKDTIIHENVQILANCVIEDSEIGAASVIGPFARIRPETLLAENVKVGNFVEVKKSQVAKGSKINHLSYIGDSQIGSMVNIGAGTITCNYDGANKYRTIIGDRAFIGSDTQLVAPVTVGAGATIGAGSTITRDAPPEELTLSRAKQFSIEGWQRPVKKPKE